VFSSFTDTNGLGAQYRTLVATTGAKAPRKADLFKLRFFAGLTPEQTAAALGISTSTAEKDWASNLAEAAPRWVDEPGSPVATSGRCLGISIFVGEKLRRNSPLIWWRRIAAEGAGQVSQAK
jgi:hypothetical protein